MIRTWIGDDYKDLMFGEYITKDIFPKLLESKDKNDKKKAEKLFLIITELREETMSLLQKEAELQEIVQLVGPDALPDEDKIILDTTKALREDFLQQNAYHEVDTYCPLEKQFLMMKIILDFHKSALEALKKGKKVTKIFELPVKEKIARMKYVKDLEKESAAIYEDMKKQMGNI